MRYEGQIVVMLVFLFLEVLFFYIITIKHLVQL